MGSSHFVVDPASVEVNRRSKQRKTDRIDAERLLRGLISYVAGITDVWSVCRIPTPEEEDLRRVHRERERLNKERTQHRNRIQGLLALQGLRVGRWPKLRKDLETMVTLGTDRPLPSRAKKEIQRELDRLELVEKQLEEVTKEQEEYLKEQTTACVQKVTDMMKLKSVGLQSAWVLVTELFAWRVFSNRREVGASAGLTGTPYDSGGTRVEQGTSKSGNRRVRGLLVELSWNWLRYQPDSALSQWFQDHYGKGAARSRRVGIVALARKLLIALWRFVEQGVVPNGGEFKKEGPAKKTQRKTLAPPVGA